MSSAVLEPVDVVGRDRVEVRRQVGVRGERRGRGPDEPSAGLVVVLHRSRRGAERPAATGKEQDRHEQPHATIMPAQPCVSSGAMRVLGTAGRGRGAARPDHAARRRDGPGLGLLHQRQDPLHLAVVRRRAPDHDPVRLHRGALLRPRPALPGPGGVPPRPRHRDAVRHQAVRRPARQGRRQRHPRVGVRREPGAAAQPQARLGPGHRPHPPGLRRARRHGAPRRRVRPGLRQRRPGRLPPALRGPRRRGRPGHRPAGRGRCSGWRAP